MARESFGGFRPKEWGERSASRRGGEGGTTWKRGGFFGGEGNQWKETIRREAARRQRLAAAAGRSRNLLGSKARERRRSAELRIKNAITPNHHNRLRRFSTKGSGGWGFRLVAAGGRFLPLFSDWRPKFVPGFALGFPAGGDRRHAPRSSGFTVHPHFNPSLTGCSRSPPQIRANASIFAPPQPKGGPLSPQMAEWTFQKPSRGPPPLKGPNKATPF